MSGIDESGGDTGGIDREAAAALAHAAGEQAAAEPETELEAVERAFAAPASDEKEPGESGELTAEELALIDEEAQRGEGTLVEPDARMDALSLATDDELAALAEHPGGLEALSDGEYEYVRDRLASYRDEQAGGVDTDALDAAVASATADEIDSVLGALDAEQLATLVEQSPLFVDRLDDQQIEYAAAKLAQRAAEPAGFDPNDPALFALDVLGRQKQADEQAKQLDDQANQIAAYATGRVQELQSELRAELGDGADLPAVRAFAAEILPDVMRRHSISGEEAVKVALAEAADRLHEPADTQEVIQRMVARQKRGLVVRDPNRPLKPEERQAARRAREGAWDAERQRDEHGEPQSESEVAAWMLQRQRERS